LIDTNEPDAETIIMDALDDAGPARALLCRVLAERDLDRDPEFALRYFYEGPTARSAVRSR